MIWFFSTLFSFLAALSLSLSLRAGLPLFARQWMGGGRKREWSDTHHLSWRPVANVKECSLIMVNGGEDPCHDENEGPAAFHFFFQRRILLSGKFHNSSASALSGRAGVRPELFFSPPECQVSFGGEGEEGGGGCECDELVMWQLVMAAVVKGQKMGGGGDFGGRKKWIGRSYFCGRFIISDVGFRRMIVCGSELS
jgi:hypothetical protein